MPTKKDTVRLGRNSSNDLHSSKCVMEVVDYNRGMGEESRYIVSFSLTAGELLALAAMLLAHDTYVQDDVHNFFENAAKRAKIRLDE